MDLLTLFKYITLVCAIGLIIVVSLQSRSGGLGTMFGGGGGGGETFRSRRGLEATLYNLTIIQAVLLAISAMAIAILSV